MSLLKKITQKWEAKKALKSPSQQLSPELKAWGYEILMEQLLDAMDPENYDIRRNGDKFEVWSRVSKYDPESSEPQGKGDFARRYTKPRTFKTHASAVVAIEVIIEGAAKHFDEVQAKLDKL